MNTHTAFKSLCSLFFMGVLAGCAQISSISHEEVAQKSEEAQRLGKARIVTTHTGPYLGAMRRDISRAHPLLEQKVSLHQKGSLEELCGSIRALLPGTMVRVQADASVGQPKAEKADKSLEPDSIASLLASDFTASGDFYRISYDGPLKGLLNLISSLSGYGWDFNPKQYVITFSKMQIRTFTFFAPPGTISIENVITNKSRDNTGSSSSINGTSTISSSDMVNQTSQSSKTTIELDVWADIQTGLRQLVSSNGSVSINKAAGSITVRDTAPRLEQIAQYISDANQRLGRQVALTVRGWSIQLSDGTDAGIDLSVLFDNGSVAIKGGSITGTLPNSVSASILSGRMKSSAAVVQALKQWGRVSQITNMSGIVMSNQPFQVHADKSTGYLAGMSNSTTDYGQTTELTAGEVTSGFAMTITPSILENRKVILQYNMNLSNLVALREFTSGGGTIQLPEVDNLKFSQRSALRLGQTLILAGYQQENTEDTKSLGFLSTRKNASFGRSIVIITIQVENADILTNENLYVYDAYGDWRLNKCA